MFSKSNTIPASYLFSMRFTVITVVEPLACELFSSISQIPSSDAFRMFMRIATLGSEASFVIFAVLFAVIIWMFEPPFFVVKLELRSMFSIIFFAICELTFSPKFFSGRIVLRHGTFPNKVVCFGLTDFTRLGISFCV
jgi:hypothetical protein